MDLTYVKKIHHNFQVISTLESSILTFAPLQSTYDNNQLLMRPLISQTLSKGETIKMGLPYYTLLSTALHYYVTQNHRNFQMIQLPD